MVIQRWGQAFIDHVTFGHSAHFLLQVLLLQFASIFLTFQFSSSLLIQISNPDLFTYAYTGASLVFFGVLVLFTMKMGQRTFSPTLYSRAHLAISVLMYLCASGAVILFGYLFLIFATGDGNTISRLDYVFTTMLTTLFAALLAVGYHARVVDDRPDREAIVETIATWEDSLFWVSKDDRSNAKQEAYEEFTDCMDDLSKLLSSAKTAEGKLLQKDFEDWRAGFETHSELSKETIIRGQGENKNERLEQEHQELKSIRRRLRIIAGQQE